MILLLDLSTTATGWAVADISGAEPIIKAMGTLKPSAKFTLGQKFAFLCDGIGEVYAAHDCEDIAFEELTHFRSANTVRALAGLRGALEFYASAVLGIHEPKPVRVSSARMNLGVKQGATKAERKTDPDIIKKRVREALNKKGVHPGDYDQADAAALGWSFSYGVMK